jgi:hypothetical protein
MRHVKHLGLCKEISVQSSTTLTLLKLSKQNGVFDEISCLESQYIKD